MELPRIFQDAIASAIKTQVTQFTMLKEIQMPTRHVRINLEIPVGTTMLDDSFDWDHDDELSTPETFAEAYCADLGLGGEFVPLVAHAIHEQVYLDRKVSASALPRGPSSA